MNARVRPDATNIDRSAETLEPLRERQSLTRRDFLLMTSVVGGGLAVSLTFGHAADASPSGAGARPDAAEVSPWLLIAPDDSVLVRVPMPETGNGAVSMMAMLVAEELQCDWRKVRAECIPLNRNVRERNLYTGVANNPFFTFAGRATNPETMQVMQQIGASARERLKAVAARQWSVPVAEITVREGVLVHESTQRRLRFGEVAAAAANVKLASEPAVKQPKEWTLLGKSSSPKLSDPEVVTGTAQYGIDVQLPGMVYAAIMQSPVHGGRLKRYDFEAIRKMPGVLGVAVIDPDEPRERLKPPANDGESHAQSAIAVVAEHYWQARKALEALPVEWDDGAGGRWKTTEQINESVIATLDREGEKVAKEQGDAVGELAKASSVIEATYLTPFSDQAPIEPLNATALYTDNRIEVWHGGSIGMQSFLIAAEEAQVPVENTHLHQMLVGGNFGRRNFADDLRLTVAVAKKFPGRPVKMIWSREEMMRQGRYRWLTAGKLKASLGEDGMPSAFLARLSRTGYGMAGLDNVPYTNGVIKHARVESRDHPLHILWGSYRAPGYNSYAFFTESFIDECAAAAKVDPLEYRLKLLDAWPDAAWKKCLSEVAERAQWGKSLPKGQGQGIAISNWGNWVSKDLIHGTTVAVVAHVDVSRAGELRVLQLDVAFDCGRVVNRDTVAAQMEGGAIFGLNMCLNEELTVRDGRIVEGNFDAYPMLRIADLPRINVHFGALSGAARFSEVGEPPVGPVGPAVANAIFRATGKRIRSMPFRKHDLSWS